jgi:hypothetical protein
MAHTAAASFEVNGLTVTPAEVYPAETVTVSATITNTGDLTGSYDATLKINGLAPQTRNVTLGGGDSQTISFTVAPDTTGEYTLDINGLSSKFKVKPPVPEGTVAEITVPTPASFIISNLSITPVEVNPSEEVTISALVTNIGGSEGSYTVVLRINDVEEARKEVTLGASKNETVTFIIAKYRQSSYTVDIGNNIGRFTVTKAIIPSAPVRTSPVKSEPTREYNWELIIGIVADGIAFIALLLYFIWWRKRRA